MKHRLLYAVSVLPALLVVPAMAADINLTELYPDGTVDTLLKVSDGNTATFNHDAINVAPSTGRAVQASGRGVLNITGKNVTVSSADEIAVLAVQGKINVNATSFSSTSNGWGALWAQNNTTDDANPFTKININADTISLTETNGYAAIAAFSQSRVDLNGDATITGSKNAIDTRGNAIVNINADGTHTTKMTGNINFNYDKDSSGTPIDATVNVTLAGAESVWNGNTIVSWDEKPNADKLAVTGMTLDLRDGATWNAAAITNNDVAESGSRYVAMNNLNIDTGTVNILDTANGITIDKTADIKNGTFTGGHVVFANGATATVSGSSFSEQTATTGGAIKNSGTLTVGGTFDGNGAVHGGAIYNNGTLTVSDGTKFENNTVNVEGSAIANYGNRVTIGDNVEFNNNAAFLGDMTAPTSGDWEIGALYSEGTTSRAVTLTIGDNVKFEGNKDARGGAGIFLFGNNTATIGDDAQFLNNKVQTSATDETLVKGGGAISLVSGWTEDDVFHDNGVASLTIGDGATFSGNGAGWGGAIDVNSAKSVLNIGDGVTFSNNTASVFGGAINNGGTVTIGDNATFSGNTGAQMGGAIIGSGDITIGTGATFSGNTATSGAGGAIAAFGGNWTIGSGATFDNANKAALGGAIYNHTGVTIALDSATFDGNQATESVGGAIYNAGTMNFTDATFQNNTAKTYGGAIYNGGTVTFAGTNTFSGNTATNGGNDIYNAGTINITGGTTSLNSGIESTGNVNVESGAVLNATGFTNHGPATFTNRGTATLTGTNKNYGTIDNKADGSLTAANLTNYVTFNNSGTASLTDATNGGTITSESGATLNITGLSNVGTGSVVNKGTGEWSNIVNGATITNESGASLSIAGLTNHGSATFTNNGTATLTGTNENYGIIDNKATGSLTVANLTNYVTFNNSGTASLTDATNGGTITSESGAMLNITGLSNVGTGSVVNKGTGEWSNIVNGATITNESGASLSIAALTNNADAELTNNGEMHLTGTTGNTGTLTNAANATLSAEQFTVNAGGLFTNVGAANITTELYNGGTVDNQAAGQIETVRIVNDGTITNAGAFDVTTMFNRDTFTNNATTDVSVTTLKNTGTFVNNGNIEMAKLINASGATFTNAGDATISGAIDIQSGLVNNGNLNIASGAELTINGNDDISGNGTFTLADGATLNLGAFTMNQSVFNLNGTLNATINSATDYARLLGDVVFDESTSVFNLTVSSVGTYKMFNSMSGDITINAGDLFDAVSTDEGIVVTTKSAAEIAENTGMSEDTANMLNNVTNATSDALVAISIAAQQELMAGNVEYVAAEMEKLNPEDKPVVQAVASTVQNEVLNLVSSRMATLTGRAGGDVALTGGGVWAQGLFNKSKYNSVFHGYTRGVSAGIDEVIEHDYTIGLGYAYGSTDIHENKGRSTDITSNTLFLYAQYKPAEWFINAVAHYTTAEYKESATVIGYSKASAHDVDSFGGSVTAGYSFASGATPELGLRYLNITQDDYVDSFGTKVSADTIQTLTSVAGVKYVFDIDVTDSWMVRPELRVAATYDIISDKAVSTVVMPGAASYIVDADRLSRVGGEFGVGLATTYYGLELSVNYDLNVHKDYTSQTGMVRARYEF